ncbi:MAG: glucose-6-phosphate isomerase [Bdellovibrio sp.]|nr:MAG: glucose-6-phosphate isomerase [Bdellovibrio sp.]
MIKIDNTTATISSSQLQSATEACRSVLANKQLGFWQLPQRPQLIADSIRAAQRLRENGDRLLLFGIGGSSLGPRFLADLYSHSPQQIGICDNADPLYLERIWGRAEDWKRGSFVFISKSGNTIETLASLQRFHEYVRAVDASWWKRALVISEPKDNPLTQWAKEKQVPVLEFPVDVGGRFSVLTPVGLMVASFMGKKAEEFMQGAAWSLQHEKLAAELVAQSLASFERKEWITMFWTYSSLFQHFGDWMVQLWAESLAKKETVNGEPAPRVSTPVAAIGATDQHSIIQQVMEGARDKWVVIHRVAELASCGPLGKDLLIPSLKPLQNQTLGRLLQAEAQATAQALAHQGVSVLELTVQDTSPSSVGALLMLWQWVVAGLGASLRINAFDQPGVELGKRLALKILSGQ